ncbi:hypothetical protein HDU92_004823 [Lobulomyces angularis]|nr:hypothetical protein HDU92_004823 [Lobulomyces angularis]
MENKCRHTKAYCTMLSGSTQFEDSKTDVEVKNTGALTNALIRFVTPNNPNPTFRELIVNIRLSLKKYHQTPQFSSGLEISLDDNFGL